MVGKQDSRVTQHSGMCPRASDFLRSYFSDAGGSGLKLLWDTTQATPIYPPASEEEIKSSASRGSVQRWCSWEKTRDNRSFGVGGKKDLNLEQRNLEH